MDTQSSLLQRGDLSSTDTLGYVSIGTEEGENLITERKLGNPHYLEIKQQTSEKYCGL